MIKLTTLIILACLMQLSAATRAQITLNMGREPLRNVLKSIGKQSGYDFIYAVEDIKALKAPVLKLQNVSIQTALEACLKDQPLVYEIKDRTVMVKLKKEPSLLERVMDYFFTIDVTGRVVDEKGEPIAGASVKVKGTSIAAIADGDGRFSLKNVQEDAVLEITSIGYKVKEVKVGSELGNIRMEVAVGELNEVSIVNTGYQSLPKERATGSFVHLNAEQLNRRVGNNILERLEGITSGLLFPNRNIPGGSNESAITIRGRSTIFANTQPLIVVDNFPYSGDISNINPNDIQSIDILKDAAAASIWGALSGNGVIVISTKKGNPNGLTIDLNTNFTQGNRPDLLYDRNFLASTDFIDVERFLFGKGFYDADLTNTLKYPVISPVIELLNKVRNNSLTSAEANLAIDQFKGYDFRTDLGDYFYRRSTAQQYSLSVNGGNERISNYLSMGFDQSMANQIGNSNKRLTLTSNFSAKVNQRLTFNNGLYLSSNKFINNSSIPTSPSGGKSSYYPYARIVDPNGKPADLPKDYRYAFISSLGTSEVLDWTYNPIEELERNNNSIQNYYARISPSLKYNVVSGLDVSLKYQYERQFQNSVNIYAQDSYYVRNQVNLFTQVTGGAVKRPIPIGGMLNQNKTDLTTNDIRAEASFNKLINQRHQINAIGGFEQREIINKGDQTLRYGYSDNTSISNAQIDYITFYNFYRGLGSGAGFISPLSNLSQLNDEFISYFSNASYTLDDKYSLSGSVRFDQSNFYGLSTNKKGIPLWSTGVSWNLSRENFYKLSFLPRLKVKATYGYNGNLDRSMSGFLTLRYSTANNLFGLPQSVAIQYPNPDLTWEKSRVVNFGLEFSSAKEILSGSIDYYIKRGIDLIGQQPIAPQTGVQTFKRNYANTTGRGIDVDLASKNIEGRDFSWNSNFLFSINTDKVVKYDDKFTNLSKVQSADGASNGILLPTIGRPLYGVYSYRFAGLDPQTGDPIGYLQNKPSKEYSLIKGSSAENDIIYSGPARPKYFGALMNTVRYKAFSASINITYKLGYFFRKSSINYGSLFNAWNGNVDFQKRWIKPGDEAFTTVPSMVYPFDSNRDDFYKYSDVLVEKGDHVRIQDVRLSYSIPELKLSKYKIKSAQLYAYVNNLGIVWGANKDHIDPDFQTGFKQPTSFAFGLKASF